MTVPVNRHDSFRLCRTEIGSVGVALALGRPLAVELGGAAFALRSFLSLGGTPFTCLSRFHSFLRDRGMFGRAFVLPFGLGLLLLRLDAVGLGFLTMPGDVSANALALALPLATTLRGDSAGRKQRQGDNDDDDDDHDNG
jgi:hypothetical protein